MTLFSSREHKDPEPRRPGEGRFAFLDRVASRWFGSVREVLEGWFAAYPASDAGRLRREFRGGDTAHTSAFFELYLHEIHRRAGFLIERDPPVEGTGRSPDFLMRKGDLAFYLEATVSSGQGAEDLRRERALETIYGIVGGVRSPDFGLRLEIAEYGTSDPPRRPLVVAISEWLQTLKVDEVASRNATRFEHLPNVRVPAGDWLLDLTAIPLREAARGDPERRALGVYPMQGGVIDTLSPLRNRLKDKAGRYGKLALPYVIAVNWMDQFAREESIMDVLWGTEAMQVLAGPGPVDARVIRQRDGFFWRGKPENSRVSAVITWTQLSAWNVTRVEPRLWSNDWARHPLAARSGSCRSRPRTCRSAPISARGRRVRC
jgi:hypothetical protein